MDSTVLSFVVLIVLAGGAYYLVYRGQVKNDQLLETLRDATDEQLQAWEDSDLRRAQTILSTRLAPQRVASMKEETRARLSYHQGRVNELLRQREHERIAGYIEDEIERQVRNDGGNQ